MFPYRFDNNASQGDPSSPAAAQPTVPIVTPRRRRRMGTAALLVAALGAGAAGGGAAGAFFATQQQPTPTPAATASTLQPIQSNAQANTTNVAGAVFGSAGPSVVRVISSGESRGGLTPEGSGSGFVIDTSGLILTNYHVVGSADGVSVRFSDGTTATADVVGTDRGNDIALLRAEIPANIPALPLANSDNVAVGETAIAIGSPFGLDGTVTQGIISAVDRTWQGSGRSQRDLIQTDAPINPGNSGGPLLNAQGEVIGINTMIESPVRGNVGVGFAVPINTAQRVLPQLQAGATLEPVWLGIASQGENGAPSSNGVVVTQVVAGSAAQQAGIQVGDTITTINGNAVTELAQLSEQLGAFQPGDRVTVTVERNGAPQQIEVTLQPWPEQIQ